MICSEILPQIEAIGFLMRIFDLHDAFSRFSMARFLLSDMPSENFRPSVYSFRIASCEKRRVRCLWQSIAAFAG